jgi:hypothetical protein
VLLGVIALSSVFRRLTIPGWAAAIVIIAVAVSAGVTYALLVARARGERILWARELTVAALLPLVGAGGLIYAAHFEPLGTSRPDLTLSVFRMAFVTASVLVAFVCTVLAAAFHGAPGAIRRSLQVAAITGVTYLACAIALDAIPGFHVGGGDHAMPKVAALCNLFAGMVGGYAAFVVLASRRPARISGSSVGRSHPGPASLVGRTS